MGSENFNSENGRIVSGSEKTLAQSDSLTKRKLGFLSSEKRSGGRLLNFFGSSKKAPADGGYVPLPTFDVAEVQTSPFVTPLHSASRTHQMQNMVNHLSPEVVICWLLESSEDHVMQVLDTVMHSRRQLLEATLHGKLTQDSTFESTTGVADTPTQMRSDRRARTESCSQSSIIQFSSAMYYCMETEQTMHIDVVRAGGLQHRCEVRYRTVSGTAIEGEDFTPISGLLVFEPGELVKSISVPIEGDEVWNATTEFGVELVEEGLVNCMLGRYLWHSRVKVIDLDTFPSSRYRTELLANQWENVSRLWLMIDYFKLNFRIKEVRTGTLKRLFVDQFHSVYLVMTLFMQVYLVDYVLNMTRSPEQLLFYEAMPDNVRTASLQTIMLLYILPYALLHYSDLARRSFGIGGGCRKFIQRALLTKFMNYNESARCKLRGGDVIMAVQRDCYDVVHDGYMTCFAIAQKFGELLAVFAFQVISPFVFQRPFRPAALLPSFIFPVLVIGFMSLRSTKTSHKLNRWQEADNAIVDQVNETVLCYRLIADYSQRPVFMERNEMKLRQFGAARLGAMQVITNNKYFMPWVSLVLASAFTLLGGVMVVSDRMTLGIFLTTLRTFSKIGKCWGDIYDSLLKVQSTFPALERITQLINLQTDLTDRLVMNRLRRRKTQELRQVLSRTLTDPSSLPLDHMDIAVQDVQVRHYAWHMTDHLNEHDDGELNINCLKPHKSVTLQGRMDIPQGQLVCLVGSAGEGKSTILKLIAGVLLPTRETLDSGEAGNMYFLPAHLRVLHLPLEPMFFQGTLLDNLTFGVEAGGADGDLTRVVTICRRLGVHDEVLHLVSDPSVLAWSSVLSQTQKALLSLARAFIANPEVLCAHKPALHFSKRRSRVVMELLHEFSLEKGLEQDPEAKRLRRPRTTVMTASDNVGLELCDQIFLVMNGTIRPLQSENIREEMLV